MLLQTTAEQAAAKEKDQRVCHLYAATSIPGITPRAYPNLYKSPLPIQATLRATYLLPRPLLLWLFPLTILLPRWWWTKPASQSVTNTKKRERGKGEGGQGSNYRSVNLKLS